jgi:THO complex subunit 4
LYISNLDFGVSNQDIKELFSEFGLMRKYCVNFAASGQSLGTAEVVYANRASAVKALRKYNNVPLDGRPMKLEVSGGDKPVQRSSLGIGARIQQSRFINRAQRGAVYKLRAGVRGGIRKTFVPRGGKAAFAGKAGGKTVFVQQRGGVRGRGRGAFRGRGGKKQAAAPTQAQLDAELEAYTTSND